MVDGAREREAVPLGDTESSEGGKTAPGESIGSREQLDGAGGGYGTESGTASSGGTGDGDAGRDALPDDGTTSGATGAAGAGPTEWVRKAPGA
jgi:hypothetical protein